MSFPLAHSFHSFEHTEHSENDSLGWIIGDFQKFSPTLLAGMKSFSMGDEMRSSFASQKSKHHTNPRQRNITREERCVDHFCLYLIDREWGPITIRFSSQLPFNVKVFLNVNRWLIRKAASRGLRVKPDDDAITDCDNPVFYRSLIQIAYFSFSIPAFSMMSRTTTLCRST